MARAKPILRSKELYLLYKFKPLLANHLHNFSTLLFSINSIRWFMSKIHQSTWIVYVYVKRHQNKFSRIFWDEHQNDSNIRWMWMVTRDVFMRLSTAYSLQYVAHAKYYDKRNLLNKSNTVLMCNHHRIWCISLRFNHS